jgi:3',5'-nucleoside bisphosphate phosphatase
MASRVDLHTHSTASDGTVDPPELLQQASGLGIRYLGVSDHDSTAGFEAMQPLLANYPDIHLIPAVEINTEGPDACHLLGYWVNPGDLAFQKKLAHYRMQRVERVRAMAEKLNALGLPIRFERVLELSKGGAVGRPHLADALIEKKLVRSRQEAFDRFLKKDGPAYIASDTPTPEEGIAVIRAAGGIPVMAHPSYYITDAMLKTLVDQGLLGYAQTYHLVATGGSDFHGPRTGRAALGSVDVPESVVQKLAEVKSQI